MIASYIHAVERITVRVTNHVPGRIDYVSASNNAYRGYLDYTLSANALEIHTMSAQPPGAGLGTLLLLKAAFVAKRHGKKRVQALAVAATARGFYLKLRFHPSQVDSQVIREVFVDQGFESKRAGDLKPPNSDFTVRQKMGRDIPNWEADTNQLEQAATSQVQRDGWASETTCVIV